ncbi:MAG: crotonase/enoyl-CoA hydratase family protein [Pseudomonadales bacterium]|nr:crotonase/enoyl-CoA hydratase family protein [Pseudomonadales bacterium]
MSDSSFNLLSYSFSDGISTIALDDGKANVMSNAMINELNQALDQAEANGGVVIITGREKMLSGGFDLGVFKAGDDEATFTMLSGGANLAKRLLSFPLPTICACSGHAIAMGVFILLSCDYRIGVEGDSKFAANEVAIGMTVPHFAIETLRQRLTPQQLNKAVNFAYYFSAKEALQAGFLDELTSADDLMSIATTRAQDALKLDANAHRESKLRMREELLKTMEEAVARDCEGWKAAYS